MYKVLKSGLFIVTLLVFFMACGSNGKIFDKYESIPGESWDVDNVIKLNVNISDTLVPYNLYVNVRNSGKYAYSNIFLFVTTYSPTNHYVVDTVELTLANDRGEWLG